MKELNVVFLEESGSQHQGSSKLIAFFGFLSLLRSQRDMFPQIFFRFRFVFWTPKKLGL